MTLSVVVSAAWATPLHSIIGMGAAAMSGLMQAGIHAFTRISSVVTEPVGLVLLGISLIGLSWLVRRRMHSSRRR
ncbi:MAG TPA: hypothetical protein VI685_29305 [Candidatus Angelobacter sp.]